MKKLMTLCMVTRDDEVLLGMKKRGFEEGRWNGFGGKVREGETIEDGAKRELQEESGIVTGAMDKVGIIIFSFANDSKLLEVHIFKVSDFEGDAVETEEMRPKWFNFDKIPYHQMWSDDEYWLPYLLSGKLFRGQFHFDRPSDAEYSSKILSMDMSEVDSL